MPVCSSSSAAADLGPGLTISQVITAARPNSTMKVMGPAIVSRLPGETTPVASDTTTRKACRTNAVMTKIAT